MLKQENQENVTDSNTTIGAGISNYRIMFVDDNEDILRTIKLALEEKGFSIQTYSDPFAALSFFKTFYCSQREIPTQIPFDLLLIDVKMPELNGIELSKEIKKLAAEANLTTPPICFITAYDEYYDILKSLFPKDQNTELCVIHKPIEIEDLTRRLKHEIALRK
jgi:CheY-like chemotaxis protein